VINLPQNSSTATSLDLNNFRFCSISCLKFGNLSFFQEGITVFFFFQKVDLSLHFFKNVVIILGSQLIRPGLLYLFFYYVNLSLFFNLQFANFDYFNLNAYFLCFVSCFKAVGALFGVDAAIVAQLDNGLIFYILWRKENHSLVYYGPIAFDSKDLVNILSKVLNMIVSRCLSHG